MSVADLFQPTREDVATFAAWCTGSCFGDWEPETDNERHKVMTDDAAYTEWRLRYREHWRQKIDGSDTGTGIVCDGTPLRD